MADDFQKGFELPKGHWPILENYLTKVNKGSIAFLVIKVYSCSDNPVKWPEKLRRTEEIHGRY